MPELPDHTPERFDDDLTSRLAALAGDAARQSRVSTAPEIRSRASRRRRTQVATLAAVAAVMVGVGWSVAAPGSDHAGDDLQPVGPPSPTSVTTAPDRSSVPPDRGKTAQEYHPEFPALQSSASPGPTPSGGWVTTFPDDLTLPFEGAKATSSDSSDWEALRSVDSWLLTPCDATEKSGYPSDDGRTDLRSIGYHGIEYAESEQLALYSSGEGAAAAMAELRQAIVQCAAERRVDERAVTYSDSYWSYTDTDRLAVAGWGQPDAQAPDVSFMAWNWNRTYDLDGNPQYGLGGGFFVVSRVGNAIFLTVSDGETDYGEPAQVRQASQDLTGTTRTFLPTLCGIFADGNGC